MKHRSVLTVTVGLVIVALACALPVVVTSDYWDTVLINVLINVLLVSSLRAIWLIGHISLGHVGFMAIGAYCSALLAKEVGLSFWIAMFVAGALPAVIALIIGYPFLRVKGTYFAILTLLTAAIIRLLAYSWAGLTGGQLGLTSIPSPDPITLPFIGKTSFDSVGNYYYLVLVVVLVSLGVLYLMERSELGRRWMAIDSNDVLAESVGMNVLWLKIVVFAVGCFFAGIAGALYAHFFHILGAGSTGTFGMINGMYIVLYMVMGGKGKFYGPVVGSVVILVLAEFCRPLGEFQPMVTAGLGLFVVFFLPEGLVSVPERLMKWWRAAKSRGRIAGEGLGDSAG